MKETDQLTATLILEDEHMLMSEENMSTETIASYTIVKRNGMLVPFRRERIVNALEAAFRDTRKIEHPRLLPDSTRQTIEKITDL